MSIFASLPAPDDEHEETCAKWVPGDPDDEERPEFLEGLISDQGTFWFDDRKGCTCGQPNAPLIYQGSHVLPSEDDPRGGSVDIALIPEHVRFWRDNPDAPTETEPEEHPDPFLRFGVNQETVILTLHNAKMIRDTLDWWITAVEEGATAARTRVDLGH